MTTRSVQSISLFQAVGRDLKITTQLTRPLLIAGEGRLNLVKSIFESKYTIEILKNDEKRGAFKFSRSDIIKITYRRRSEAFGSSNRSVYRFCLVIKQRSNTAVISGQFQDPESFERLKSSISRISSVPDRPRNNNARVNAREIVRGVGAFLQGGSERPKRSLSDGSSNPSEKPEPRFSLLCKQDSSDENEDRDIQFEVIRTEKKKKKLNH